MSSNVFIEQPEFIQTDPRTERPEQVAYRVGTDFMRIRHEILLPRNILAGKTVLDLGSSNGASGAWVLDAGAKSYVGVEMQPAYIAQSRENLAKYYSQDRWEIVHLGIEEFLSKLQGKFDIVIALGIAHAFANGADFLNAIAAKSNFIAIDGTHPYTITRSPSLSNEFRQQFVGSDEYVRFIENEPFVALEQTGMSLHNKTTVLYDGYIPSMGFMTKMLQRAGHTCTPGVNEALKKHLPNVYSPTKKFGLTFIKGGESEKLAIGLAQNVIAGNSLRTVEWDKA